MTATYTNLQNSYYVYQQISKVTYKFTNPADHGGPQTVYVMKDPSNGTMASSIGIGSTGSNLQVEVTFYLRPVLPSSAPTS